MKRLVLLSAFALFFITGCAQKDLSKTEIPSVVINALEAEFDHPENPEWEKNGEDFEVEFEIAEVEHEAIINSSGKILKYKKDIMRADLPEAVVSKLDTDFADKKIDDFELLNIDGQQYYQVEIEEMLRDKNVVFNAAGKETSDIPVWD